MADAKKILLIEDDKMIIEMYNLKFASEGFSVVTAETGSAGLEEAKKMQPDVILLDIILPEMDGFSVLKALKEDPKTQDIPVILLTNLGQEGDVQRGFELGAVDYLIKANYTPAQVVERLTALF